MQQDNDNNNSVSIEAAYSDSTLILRVIGLGNMNSALVMRDFITDSMKEKSVSKIILDLKDCTGLDSTFMGTMVCVEGIMHDVSSDLMLCNISEHNMSLLKMLGVDKLLNVCGNVGIPELDFTPISLLPADPEARIELIRHAHKCLIKADEKNHERFGNFLAVLEAEIQEKNRR